MNCLQYKSADSYGTVMSHQESDYKWLYRFRWDMYVLLTEPSSVSVSSVLFWEDLCFSRSRLPFFTDCVGVILLCAVWFELSFFARLTLHSST